MEQKMTATKVKETLGLIPPRVTTETVQSCLFMKKLTTAAISNIAYTRDLCPMNCFQVMQFENINLRMFKEDCENDRVQFFRASLKSAFEALEKEYLQSLVVCFYESDDSKSENLMECYTFDYTYSSENSQLTFCTETKGPIESKQAQCDITDIKEQTKSLMQFILVMTQSYPRLPASTYITLRAYYNDNAPEDYQAPNYLKGNTERDYIAKSVNIMRGFGAVKTPFHQLASYWFVNDMYDKSDVPMASQMPLASTNPHVLNSLQSYCSTGTIKTIKATKCVCASEYNEKVWKQITINCKYCGEAAHAACYGVRWRAAASGRLAHCCVQCAAERGCPPSDPSLVNSSQAYRKTLCLIRQALDLCDGALEDNVRTISPMDLMIALHLSEVNTYKLVVQLANFGVLILRGDMGLTLICEINPENLQNNIDRLFIPLEKLPTTTSGKREQPSDPLVELADDMERLNYEDHDSSLCRVVERAASEPDGDHGDGTFKLYMDVLPDPAPEDDELPLSGSHNPINNLSSKKNTYDDATASEDEREDEAVAFHHRTNKRNAPDTFYGPAKVFKGRNSEKIFK